MKIVLFDLDHTLLSGDSDVLWCEYLMDIGVLDRATFAAQNADMEARYKAGSVEPQAFADFYVSTLAGRSLQECEPWRREFLQARVLPVITDAARELVRSHQDAGELVVLTTATNRYITELTAQALGITHLIATEVEMENSRFTGRTRGIINMRGGKVTRLQLWLAERGEELDQFESTAYSDSINDLPLLECVNLAVAVGPDARLEAIARSRRWPILRLQ